MAYETRDYFRGDEHPEIRFQLPQVSRLFWGIAGACLLLFIVQSATRSAGGPLERWGSLTFADGRAFWQPWRWVTYQYLHADASHIFFNLLALYFFLPWIESLWGWRKTLVFYTIGGIAAGVTYGLISLVVPYGRLGWLVGASGSIFAILGACALFFPDRRVIFIFIPMTVWALAALYGAFFLLSALADRDLSDAAHLGGLAFGYFAPYLAGPKLRDLRERTTAKRVARERRSILHEQAEVDRILAKVSAQGMHTLTRAEQKTLKQASERRRR